MARALLRDGAYETKALPLQELILHYLCFGNIEGIEIGANSERRRRFLRMLGSVDPENGTT